MINLDKQVKKLIADMKNQLPPFMSIDQIDTLTLRVRSVQFGKDDAYISLPDQEQMPATVRFNSHGDGDILEASVTTMMGFWPERTTEAAHSLCVAVCVVLPPYDG